MFFLNMTTRKKPIYYRRHSEKKKGKGKKKIQGARAKKKLDENFFDHLCLLVVTHK